MGDNFIEVSSNNHSQNSKNTKILIWGSIGLLVGFFHKQIPFSYHIFLVILFLGLIVWINIIYYTKNKDFWQNCQTNQMFNYFVKMNYYAATPLIILALATFLLWILKLPTLYDLFVSALLVLMTFYFYQWLSKKKQMKV